MNTATCNGILFSLGENVQKTMGKDINKNGYKMPFFGTLCHMQMMVELMDVVRCFSIYPEPRIDAENFKVGNFIESFRYISGGNLQSLGRDAFEKRLKHLKSNTLLPFSTSLKAYFQSSKTFFNSATKPSAMPFFLMETSLAQFRTVSKHDTINIFAKGNLCGNSVNVNRPLTSFKFKPVGGSDDDAQTADNCQDFAITSINGRLVSLFEHACAFLKPRIEIPSDSDLDKTYFSTIELLNSDKDLELFQHLPSDLEAAAPSPGRKKNDQAGEGTPRAKRRNIKPVVRLGQQDDGTETESKSSRSTLTKAKAPPSVATSAITLVPLYDELKNLEIPKEKRGKLMNLFFQVASAATSTKVNNAKSFERKMNRIVRPKSRKKAEEETETADAAAAKKSKRSHAESKEEKPGAVGRKKSDETPIIDNDVLDSYAENNRPQRKKPRTVRTKKKANTNSNQKKPASVSSSRTRIGPRKLPVVSYSK